MHPLIADGGEMTVLRDLAAFSYGRWSVDWPESVPEDQRPELPDDRDFGYASKLKQDPGRFGRRFVRADVTIKAQDFDDAGEPIPFSGESDVEETLDDAATRTDGDVFFEREITRAGLGALQPRVDFDVDSIVPVLIWGKTIPSPVTSIEDVVEQGAVVDYRVHVGGQLLQDDAARERANREVEATIAQERRERVKADSRERKARRAAVSAESDARRADVESVRGVLTGGGERQADLVAALAGLNRQLQGGGEAPAPGLIPAYLQMNTRLWQMQEETNRALRRSDEALQAGQDANSRLIQVNAARQREIQANQSRLEDQSRRLNNVIADVQRRQPQFIAFGNGGGSTSLGAVSIERGNLVFQKYGSWTGTVAVFMWVDAILAYPFSSTVYLGSYERSTNFNVGTFESVKAGLAIIVPD